MQRKNSPHEYSLYSYRITTFHAAVVFVVGPVLFRGLFLSGVFVKKFDSLFKLRMPHIEINIFPNISIKSVFSRYSL